MKLFLLIISFLGFLSIYAQDCNLTISGTVTDEHDGSDLSFATISILGTTKGVVADFYGKYEMSGLCKGPITLVIQHLGCEPDTISINLKESEILHFKLEHHAEELREIAIEAARKEPTIVKSTISSTSLFENSGKPMAAMLSEINGVSQLNSGSNVSKPMISGFKNNRVKIINHGVQLQSQQWGDEHAPEVDPFAANEYEVIKGAAGIKYASGALGGVVIANPKQLPFQYGIGGAVHSMYASNNRMLYSGATLEGKIKQLPNFAWRAQGSWKKAGYNQTPDYYLKNTAAKELNGSALLAYTNDKWNVNFYYSQFNTEVGIFTGAHIGNLTDLKAAIDRKQPRAADRSAFSYKINRPHQRVIHEMAKIDATYYPENSGKIQLTVARQFNIREEFDKDKPRNKDLAELDIPEFSLGLETYTAKVNWEIDRNALKNAEVGVEFQNITNTVNSFTDFIPDYQHNQYAAFFVKDWKATIFNYSAGLRFDYTDYTVDKLINRRLERFEMDFIDFTATAGINKNWKEKHQLFINAVVAQRAPAINELFSAGLHHGAASLEFGNNKLGNETSYSLNADYILKHNNITLNSYFYFKYIEDFIYLSPNGLELTIRGAYPSYQWKNTNALIGGIDQSIDWNFIPNFQFSSQLSLLWGNNLSSNNYLINMPSHQWKNTLHYQIDKDTRRWSFKFGNQWVGKQQRYNLEEEIAKPPEAYSLLFSGINFKTYFTNKSNLTISLEGENLLNKKYRDYLNRFRYFADERGRDLILRINYQF